MYYMYMYSYTLEERLDIVEAFHEDTSLRHTVRDNHLKCLPDLYRIMKKLQKGKGALVVSNSNIIAVYMIHVHMYRYHVLKSCATSKLFLLYSRIVLKSIKLFSVYHLSSVVLILILEVTVWLWMRCSLNLYRWGKGTLHVWYDLDSHS